MAKKLPYIQLFPADYKADTRHLKPATRGIWVDVFLYLHEKTHSRGEHSADVAFWCRVAACNAAELWSAIGDLTENDHAGEGEAPRVEWGNADAITFRSRRIIRDERKRSGSARRVKAFRERRKTAADDAAQRACNAASNGNGNGSGNAPDTPTYSESQSLIPPTPKDLKAQPPSTGAPGAGGRPKEAEKGGPKSKNLEPTDVPLYPVFKVAAKEAGVSIGEVARVLVAGQAPAITLAWVLMVASDLKKGTCKSAPALFRSVSDGQAPPVEFYEEAKAKLRAYHVKQELPADVMADVQAWCKAHAVGGEEDG